VCRAPAAGSEETGFDPQMKASGGVFGNLKPHELWHLLCPFCAGFFVELSTWFKVNKKPA